MSIIFWLAFWSVVSYFIYSDSDHLGMVNAKKWAFFVIIFGIFAIPFYLISRRAYIKENPGIEGNFAFGGLVTKAAVDIPGELKKWADLRDSGVLSEDEFAQKKDELLGKEKKSHQE